MDNSQNSWISAVLLEHACKHNMKGVMERINQDVLPSIVEHFDTSESTESEETKADPIVLFICTLKEFCNNLLPLENFHKYWSGQRPFFIIDLLESTYKQNSYTTLKKFLTLTSGLKLLDLLNLIVEGSESGPVIRKLHLYFPTWNPDSQVSFEKDFNVTSQKVTEKVKQSNAQCRKLILKLAADKAYKAKYIEKQYLVDLNRLTSEFKTYITEIITALEGRMGLTTLEKFIQGEVRHSDDLAFEILREYVCPSATEDSLLRYLEDFGQNLNSEATPCLLNCLNPFESMSEDESISEDEDLDDEDDLECMNGAADLDFSSVSG